MNFDSLVNMPIFDVFGVPARISYGEDAFLDLVAIDRTRGVEVEDLNVGIISVRPVAAVRAAALVGIDLADIEEGTITLNGVPWRIKSAMERQTPFGAADGQVWLILTGGGS
jgi:hypothetical protein